MTNIYLISSEVNSVVTYYTADSNGILSSIGTTLDFTKGFSDDILAAISNTAYAGLTNGKLWRDTTDTTSGITVNTTGDGIVITNPETAVSTKGYSGIVAITPTTTGDVRFALSFMGNESFMTRALGNVVATDKLLPSSTAARADIATIDTAYNALFDDSELTSYTSSVALNTIPLLFNATRKLRKFVGKLGPNCILPVTVTLQIYDTTTTEYKDVSTINVAVTDTEFAHVFDNAETNTKYQFKLEYTADGSGKGLDISELNVYEEVSKMVWVGCTKDEVATKGLTSAAIIALTALEYTDIFNNSQLDYIAYVPAGATFTDIVIGFPANTAPTVTNFTATPNSVHAENVDIGFMVNDLEKMSTTYHVSVNGVELVPTTPTPESTIVSGITIPNADLNTIGTNTITIIATDELNATNTYNFNVTKVDNLPTYVGSLSGNTYTFSISDADGDKVKFSTQLNNVEIEAETSFSDVTLTHTTVMNSLDILIGVTNTLVITITDAVGGVTVIVEEFIGEYIGLMFSDEFNNYLSTDLGDLLKYLDFGTIIAGYDSLPKEVQVINKTKLAISSIVVTGPNDLNGKDSVIYTDGVPSNQHIEGTIYAKLCADDTFALPVNMVDIKDLNPDEKASFYVKIMSTVKSDEGDFTFNVSGTGKTN